MRQKVTLLIRGERALFRNLTVPGFDIADTEIRERSIKGLIGNLLGLWRDFNDAKNLDLFLSLKKWWNDTEIAIKQFDYNFKEQVALTQHRYKGIKSFTQNNESSPRNMTYHFGVKLQVELELNESAAKELIEAVKKPIGIPYMGQSNCLAQIHIMEE